ncbi:immunoglobulin gamma-1 heavy chain-like isoform X3 [Mustelus asterias]
MGTAPYLCVLLFCLTGVRSDIVLTQPESVVKKPGQSVKLSCTFSGFNLEDYYISWVKQVPGKGLEWLLYHDSNPGGFAPGIEGRFTPSAVSNTAYIEITNLRVDDTAIYYCARQRQSTVLDYWGSGTFVEVTSVTQTAPLVYIPNTSCDMNSNQGEISLVCLVKDFQPKDITQTWSRNNRVITTGIKKFPPVQGRDMKYTMSSVLKVSASDWNTNSVYHCKAGHDSNTMVERQYTRPKSPNVIPLVPSAEVIYNQTTAVLGCMISGFAPDSIQVSWKKGQVGQTGVVLPSKQRPGDTFETVSYLTVPVVDWKRGDVYVCQVTHTPSNFNRGISLRYREEMSVLIQTPSIREVWMNKTATLECSVVCSDPSPIQILWEVSDKRRSDGVLTRPPTGEGSLHIIVSQLRTSAEEWESGVEFVCSVHGAASSAPVSKRISRAKVKPKSPTVRLLPPTEEEMKSKNTATLECLITGFYPDLVNVTWEKDGVLISSKTRAGLTALEQAETFSVRHYLTVSTVEWRKGSAFTCAVSHPPSHSNGNETVKNIQGECLDTGISVTLRKPPFEEIWRDRTATILCEILHGDLEGARVTWLVDGIVREDGVKTQSPKRHGDRDVIFSRLTVPAAEWESGVEYLCSVEDKSLPTPEKRSIRKAQVEVKTQPQVYLLPPSSDEMETDQTATLVCLVTGFSPAEIYLAWMANDTLLKSGFVNQPVTEDGRSGWNSGSQLTVSADEWNSGTTYSCVVGHESVTTNLFRSINKSHSKPTLVNVSLVLTESYKSCS